MARLPRITIPGIPYHVTQRGNRKQNTFFDQNDFKIYLKFLELACKTHDLEILAYCLMNNHVHLLLVPHTETSLVGGVSQTHYAYTKYINRRNEWKGHLWQGRFYSNPVQPERVGIVANYIELNPVRAGICDNPRDYQWSSASKGDAVLKRLSPHIETSLLLNPSAENESPYEQIRKLVKTGRVFGSDQFVKELEQRTARILAPKRPGPRGIAALEEIGSSGVAPN